MTARSYLLQFSVILFTVFVVACGSDTSTKTGATLETAEHSIPKVDAVTGYTDPACRMKISPDAHITHTHEGVTYGFCGEGCKKAFVAEPNTFLAALEE